MNTMILAAYTAAYWTNMFETVVIIGGTCVALPIVIVWLVVRARTQKMNRKMDILMKAVESGQQVDPALLVTAETGEGKYQLKKNILNRLAWGSFLTLLGIILFMIPTLCFADMLHTLKMTFITTGGVSCAAGVGMLISYFVGRKMLAKEMEAEEAEMTQKK